MSLFQSLFYHKEQHSCRNLAGNQKTVYSYLTQAEGYVTGLGAKLFIIAGPVIVYGVTASVVFGAVLWILHMFGITLF